MIKGMMMTSCVDNMNQWFCYLGHMQTSVKDEEPNLQVGLLISFISDDKLQKEGQQISDA